MKKQNIKIIKTSLSLRCGIIKREKIHTSRRLAFGGNVFNNLVKSKVYIMVTSV